MLGQLACLEHRLQARPGHTIVSGDVALGEQSWRLVAVAVRQSFERATRGTLVPRRSEGRCRIVIAAPWG